MPKLDPEIRIAALEAIVARLLVAQARQQPDPAGMLDAFAARVRRDAEGLETDSPMDRMAMGAALLQVVTVAKERLITE